MTSYLGAFLLAGLDRLLFRQLTLLLNARESLALVAVWRRPRFTDFVNLFSHFAGRLYVLFATFSLYGGSFVKVVVQGVLWDGWAVDDDGLHLNLELVTVFMKPA